ncbi:hypothetical protein CUJ84_Chr001898 [Rhizobium leguminosarum]|uniref:Uncharacterized protein n=1 Tax=Rhizobium leguminosarum TaxID=384 RepID=A0A2K9Z1Y4_RHILE|nr:hypothetical protein CUJ84_Chr001898 [Rhizobium leguminosarum]
MNRRSGKATILEHVFATRSRFSSGLWAAPLLMGVTPVTSESWLVQHPFATLFRKGEFYRGYNSSHATPPSVAEP